MHQATINSRTVQLYYCKGVTSHYMPAGDEINHQHTINCPCNPQIIVSPLATIVMHQVLQPIFTEQLTTVVISTDEREFTEFI